MPVQTHSQNSNSRVSPKIAQPSCHVHMEFFSTNQGGDAVWHSLHLGTGHMGSADALVPSDFDMTMIEVVDQAVGEFEDRAQEFGRSVDVVHFLFPTRTDMDNFKLNCAPYIQTLFPKRISFLLKYRNMNSENQVEVTKEGVRTFKVVYAYSLF